MQRVLIAFFLGLFSFFVFMVAFMFAGQTVGPVLGDIAVISVIFIVMAAYFFICQFFASRGNPDALRKDWPVMLALDAGATGVAFITALVEKREVFLTQGLGFLLVCCAGTFAGAFVASREARRRGRRDLNARPRV